MSFDITSITLDGTQFVFLDGTFSISNIPGNVKQWSGGEWKSIEVPGKAPLKRIAISGMIQSDEDKVALEALRDSGSYTYTDGEHTLDGSGGTNKVVVMDVVFSYDFGPAGGKEWWDTTLILEEYAQ